MKLLLGARISEGGFMGIYFSLPPDDKYHSHMINLTERRKYLSEVAG